MWVCACRRCLLCLCLCVALLPSSLLEGDSTTLDAVCDDGKVGADIGDPKQWQCHEDHLQATKLQELQPSYQEECYLTAEEYTAECMDVPIVYHHHPPSSGNYRHRRPKYGEYKYLPPERWLAALMYGAVVFLYHPCAPQEQVAQLRLLARSCLWRHFISPYSYLDSDWPMAVVSWGCVLRIRRLEIESLKEWITSHALHTPITHEVSTDGDYEDGLLENAARVEVDGKEVVCPRSPHPPTLTHLPTSTLYTEQQTHTKRTTPLCPTPPTPKDLPRSVNHTSSLTHNPTCLLPPAPTCCPTNTSGHSVLHHHVAYTVLMFVAVIVLLCVLIVSTWTLCVGSGLKRRRARYKSVSKFFPFSYGQQLDGSEQGVVSVAMPEYGLPKSGQAEKEMLLKDSDEDEI